MILDLLLIGLVITLEPIPLTAFLLILLSKGGTRKGAAFIFGWLLSLAIVVALTILVTGNKPPKPNTAPSLAGLAVKIAIGVALVLIAVRQRRRMGKPRPPKKTPKWQTGLDNMSPLYAIGLAPLVQPWGLVAAGVAVITEAKLTSLGELHRPLPVLPGGHCRVYRPRDLCRLPAGAGPGIPRAHPNVDRHPHRSGDHRRFAGPGALVGRQEHLSPRDVTASTQTASDAGHDR